MLMVYLPADKVTKGKVTTEVRETASIRVEAVSAQPEEVPQTSGSSDIVAELATAGFDTEKAMVFTHKDVDFYRTILTVFASEYDERYAKLSEYYRDKRWKDYSILIHAIKSNATTIGAMKLAEVALLMEQATKNEDMDTVNREHENALAQYTDAALTVKKVLGISGFFASGDSDIMEFAPNQEPEIFEFTPEGK